MDLETALDHHTIISVVDAMTEIENHGFVCHINGGVLYGSDKYNEFEQICIVVKGQVHSRPVMLWLGY